MSISGKGLFFAKFGQMGVVNGGLRGTPLGVEVASNEVQTRGSFPHQNNFQKKSPGSIDNQNF